MLALNASSESPIQYYPLSKNAYNAARDSLVDIGFSPQAILDDYSFSTRKEQLVKVNALAFAHPTHRTPVDYAGFTLYNAANGVEDQEIVQILAHTAAPFHLIHRHDKFSFWISPVQNNEPRPIRIESDIDYTQLNNVLNNYAVDLKPQKIAEVKQGRARFTSPAFAGTELQPLQLSLWAIDVTRPLLVKYFGLAVKQLRDYLKQDEDTVVDLATQLLGAVILADTGALGDQIRKHEQTLGLDRLIQTAQNEFPNYFKEQLFSDYVEAAQQAYDTLRQIRYVGFAPDMLTEIYRAAYDDKRRKELGRYDTPLYLTRRIWENIPVEFLPPDQRVAVDMTCGWGSFLQAGYKRLSGLSDMQGVSLRQYLHGNDIEPLAAARLAGLGLLISTSEDSWHVDAEDALKWKWLDRNQPNIIVGNPPFGGARKGDQKRISLDKRERYEEANKFLEHAIDRLAPNGYLAMLMPQSFVAAEASPGLRKQLLESCDVHELWELPIGVFPEATAGTIVIFAQKKDNSLLSNRQRPVRVRTVQRQTLEGFERLGVFTISGLAVNQAKWDKSSRRSKSSKNTYIMDFRFIMPEFAWARIKSHCIDLQQLAVIFVGGTVGNPEKGSYSNYQFPRKVPWLTNAKRVIKRPFFIDYEQSTTIIYPNGLERPRKDMEQSLAGQKILLTATSNPSWGRRIKVAIERKQYFVSNSFWIIAPKPETSTKNITLESLAAVLNWCVSNAWMVEHLKYPWLQSRALDVLPFPTLNKTDSEYLTEAVRQLEAAAIANQPEPADALQTIDTILKAAYQLDDETYHRLTMIYEWDKNPQITLDAQPDPNAQWEISGIVEEINASNGTITLWLNGFDHFETVPITPVMPGWLLRPQVGFHTTIPRSYAHKYNLEGVSWGKFYPQEYTYLSEEELFEQLTQVFYPETETR